MPCSYKRKDVSRIVLEVLRHIHDDPTIVESTVFGSQGINADAMFRSNYFFPIKISVEKVDCLIKKFSPSDCEQAKTVSDIVDAVWNDFKPDVTSALNIGEGAGAPVAKKAVQSARKSKAKR